MRKKPPILSVIVATHNRRELLRRCLESLRTQRVNPIDVEIIVADDGSDDGSADMAEGFQMPFPMRVMRLSKEGQAAAQNKAVDIADGQGCLFLDDDTIASEELLTEHAAAHRPDGPGNVLAIGAIDQEPLHRRDWYAHCYAAAWTEHYAELADRPPRWSDCYGANFSAPRASLLEVNGFATDLPRTVDLELAFRLCQIGLVPTYLPRAHCVHDDQKGRVGLLADVGMQGTSHVEVARRHPSATAEMLDWHSAAGSKELLLRRMLIALRIPPAAPAMFGAWLPGAGRKMIWMHFIRRLAFWRAARRAMPRSQWKRVTRQMSSLPVESLHTEATR